MIKQTYKLTTEDWTNYDNLTGDPRPYYLGVEHTKRAAYDLIRKEFSMTPTYSYSYFCKAIREAREEGSRWVKFGVGRTGGFSYTVKVDILC